MKPTSLPRTYKHDTAMLEALKRVREVYPTTHRLATSGAVGNEKQFSPYMEWK